MKRALLLNIPACVVLICWFMHQPQEKEKTPPVQTEDPANNTVRNAIELVKSVLHVTPEVIITTYVEHQQNSDILELASINRRLFIPYEFRSTWLGSRKELRLYGNYSIKAGFDLRDQFSIQIEKGTNKIRAYFPAPKILSVQQDKIAVLEDNSGAWNRITDEDRERALNDINAYATQHAFNILEEAKNSLRCQLQTLGKKSGQEWEIHFAQ